MRLGLDRLKGGHAAVPGLLSGLKILVHLSQIVLEPRCVCLARRTNSFDSRL